MRDDYEISTDKSRLNLPIIHQFLSERSYWAKGRSDEAVQKSIDHSLCFGVYHKESGQVGFARVVTDYTVFAYILDVFILEDHRGQGLGKALMETVINFPPLKGIRKWQLATNDAHGLYEKVGFRPLATPEKLMEKVNANPAVNLIRNDAGFIIHNKSSRNSA